MVKKSIFKLRNISDIIDALIHSKTANEFVKRLRIRRQVGLKAYKKLNTEYRIIQAFKEAKNASDFARKAHMRKQRALKLYKELKNKLGITKITYTMTIDYNGKHENDIYLDINISATVRSEFEKEQVLEEMEKLAYETVKEHFGEKVADLLEESGIQEESVDYYDNYYSIEYLWKHDLSATARSRYFTISRSDII